MAGRFLTQLVLVLVVSFGAAVSLIRAQPDNPRSLAVLPALDTGCAQPCFLGIQPGDTSVYRALSLLNDHAWVRRVDTTNERFYVFQWSGAQPVWIDPTIPGYFWTLNDIVQRITIPTTLPQGDLALALGQFDASVLPLSRERFRYDLWYSALGWSLISQHHCPSNLIRAWASSAAIQFALPAIALDGPDRIDGPLHFGLCA